MEKRNIRLQKILTKSFLIKEYKINANSAVYISKLVCCSATVIYKYLRKHTIKIRNPSERQRGSKNPNWKGIKAITNKQYYCKKCKSKIKSDTYLYGSKLCGSCASHTFIDGRTNKKHYCIDCGKELINIYAKRCTSCSTKKKWQNKEYREKLRRIFRKKWEDISYREKALRAMHEGRKCKPNKPEKTLNRLLNKLLPKEYKYVGDGNVILGGFNPDFININGQKKILEFYGCYWHKCPKCKFGNKRLLDVRRLKTYKKYGYKTLIIWGHELKDLNKVKNRILNFHKTNLTKC